LDVTKKGTQQDIYETEPN